MGTINSTGSFATAMQASQFSKLAVRGDETKALQPERNNSPLVQDKSDKQHALVSYLKMPAVSENSGLTRLVSLITKPEQLQKELVTQGARTKLLAHHVAIQQDMLKTLRQEPSGSINLSFALPAGSAPLARTPKEPIDVSAFNHDNLAKLDDASTAIRAYKFADLGDLNSSWELCDSVANSIGAMRENYLDVFQNAVQKYAAFFDELTKLLAKFGQYISADGDKTVVNGKDFYTLCNNLVEKYSLTKDATLLYSGSSDDCNAWAKQMGLDPDKCVVYTNGKYSVRIDTSPLKALTDEVYKLKWTSNSPNVKLNSAQFAALQSAIDMQKDTIQNAMQTITQKYSNANSTFENLIKILSSTITSLLDTDKSFLTV